jgi:Polyphosphate kinase
LVKIRLFERKDKEVFSTITQLHQNCTQEFETAFESLKKELATRNVLILDENQISDKQKREIHALFTESLYRHLYPRIFSLNSNFEDITKIHFLIKMIMNKIWKKFGYVLITVITMSIFVACDGDNDDPIPPVEPEDLELKGALTTERTLKAGNTYDLIGVIR